MGSESRKPYSVGFYPDPKLSRERGHICLRAVQLLRTIAEVHVFEPDEEEEDVLQQLETAKFDVLILPWYLYLRWSKIEGYFGFTRTQGPTVVGYFGEPIFPHELDLSERWRIQILDFSRLTTLEGTNVLKSLLRDSTRWGLRPLLLPSTDLYFESWSGNIGMGFRMDSVLSIPAIQGTPWTKRSNALRMCFSALWSLIYDHGPGRIDMTHPGTNPHPKAYFQLGADAQALGMRLCFKQSSWKAKEVLRQFWPSPSSSPTTPGQILARYGDLLRVHVDPETNELEVTVMFYPSAPSEQAPSEMHSLWIEPLSSSTRNEAFSEAEHGETSGLKPLINHHQLITEAAGKISLLRKELEARDALIRELKSGGLGSQSSSESGIQGLDGEALLGLFQEKVQQMGAELRSLQIKVQSLSQSRFRGEDTSPLKEQMKILEKKQRSWLTRLTKILEVLQIEREPEADRRRPPPRWHEARKKR
jgi:hypothetical protein